MYAVIDTNVFVSALITKNPASPTRAVYDYIDSGDIIPLYNDEIIAEYREVLPSRKAVGCCSPSRGAYGHLWKALLCAFSHRSSRFNTIKQ